MKCRRGKRVVLSTASSSSVQSGPGRSPASELELPLNLSVRMCLSPPSPLADAPRPLHFCALAARGGAVSEARTAALQRFASRGRRTHREWGPRAVPLAPFLLPPMLLIPGGGGYSEKLCSGLSTRGSIMAGSTPQGLSAGWRHRPC